MTEDALLAALGERRWRSGADLAKRLGVSRTAIWKGVERLRARGYAVEAVAGRGYRLREEPDLLLPGAIRRCWTPALFCGEIVHCDTVDSTNRLAAELARGGAAEGTAVVAEHQSAGRGRLGRRWESPRGKNLYLSIVLRPALGPVQVAPLPLVAAVAAVDAVRETIPAPAEIKWPNDVLIGGRKAVGILTELEAEAERVRFVILGIGVNLNASRSDFPPELRGKATSLRIASGARIDRARFTGLLLGALEKWYGAFLRGGFAGVRRAYQRDHCLAGRRVTVQGGASGKVQGVDASGRLVVVTRHGTVRIAAGEVSLAETYAGAGSRARAGLPVLRERRSVP